MNAYKQPQAFWVRANPWFTERGIIVPKVLSEHWRGRPYRPQNKSTVEGSRRTPADEWAYAQLHTSDAKRCAEVPIWLHSYSSHRGHTALGSQPPASRIPYLSGQCR